MSGTTTEVPSEPPPRDEVNTRITPGMLALELVPLPVADVDRAIAFYVGIGFQLDVDVRPAEGVRYVQLTPPGSACSIALTTGVPYAEGVPGAVRGLHLVVADMAAARAALTDAGVPVGEPDDVGGGVLVAHFADPDGNTWALQYMPWRV